MQEQSSIRDMFQFPNPTLQKNNKKKVIKRSKTKRNNNGPVKPQKQSLWKTVLLIKNVGVFIQNMKKRIAQNRSFSQHNLKPSELQFLENDSHIQIQAPYFAHENKLILASEIMFIVIMLLYYWECTYQMVLGHINDFQVIKSYAIIVYLIHIFLQQVTELKNQKCELVNDLNQIRQIYIKQKLIRDVISIITLVLQITPLDNPQNPIFTLVIRLVSLISFFQMSNTCDKVEQIVTISVFGQTTISCFKLLYKLFIFIHSMSIFLVWLVTIQKQYGIEATWLSNPNLVYSTNLQKYVLAWYWASTILSSVEFGEITPYNNIERFIVSLLEVVSCIFFGYFVNAVGEMIKVRNEFSQKYVKQVRSLNRFLNVLTISNDLKNKLRSHYFNKNLVQQLHDPKEEKEVLKNITPSLKTSLLQEINLKIIQKCNQFDQFRSQTINSIAQAMKRIILAPQFVLYSRNSNERKIWFVQSGTVEQYTDIFKDSNLRKVVSIYEKKQPLVGWINFMTPHTYKTLAKSKNFVVAHELDEDQFLKCVNEDVRQYHKFNQIKQKMLLKKRIFHNKCISCGRYTHNVIDCPRIHFVKKQGSKLSKQKQLLNRFISDQTQKHKRGLLKYNWKKLFGIKSIENEIEGFLNNDTMQLNISGGDLTKSNSFRKSVMGFQQRRVSLMVLNKDIGNFRKEIIKMGSNDQIQKNPKDQNQQFDLQFQKIFFNKDNNDYFPDFDIQKVLAGYHKLRAAKKTIL